VICDGGHGGRIDLLCYDRKQERYVVIEIKNVRANQNTFGQIHTYIGWVQDMLRPKKNVWGIVVSRGCDARFESSMKASKRVQQIDLSEIGIE
jgi:RecB family endonuclease NucS